MAEEKWNTSDNDTIVLSGIKVMQDRVRFDVRITKEEFFYSTPALIRAVLDVYPNIAQHDCVNSVGPTFESVMCRTMIPHVLEHLILELEMQDYRKQQAKSSDSAHDSRAEHHFFGTSEWLSKKQGTARIEVSFSDDLVALRAARSAFSFLNGLL